MGFFFWSGGSIGRYFDFIGKWEIGEIIGLGIRGLFPFDEDLVGG